MTKKFAFLLLAIVFVFSACQKDDEMSENNLSPVSQEHLTTISDGETIIYDNNIFTIADSMGVSVTGIYGYSGIESPDNPDTETFSFRLWYVGEGIGTFTEIKYIHSWRADVDNNQEVGYNCIDCEITVNITLDEGPGGFIEGTYEGAAQDIVTGNTIPISAEFRIQR